MRENGYNFGNVAPQLGFRHRLDQGPARQLRRGAHRAGPGVLAARPPHRRRRRHQRLARRAVHVHRGCSFRTTGSSRAQADGQPGPALRVRGRHHGALQPLHARLRFPGRRTRSRRRRAPTTRRAPIPAASRRSSSGPRGGLTVRRRRTAQPRACGTPDRNNFAPARRPGLSGCAEDRAPRRLRHLLRHRSGIDRQRRQPGRLQPAHHFIASLDNGQTFRATLANPFPDGIAAADRRVARACARIPGPRRHASSTRTPRQPLHAALDVLRPARSCRSASLVDASYVGNRGTKTRREPPVQPGARASIFRRSPVRDQPTIDFLSAQVTNPFFGMPGVRRARTLGNQRIARSQLLRPYPQFTGITANLPVGLFLLPLAADRRVEKRFSRGLHRSRSAYTWSKFMEATGYLNDTDPRPEKVISDQDRPHRFVLSGIYELPFGRGKPAARELRAACCNTLDWRLAGAGLLRRAERRAAGLRQRHLHRRPARRPAAGRPSAASARWFNVDAGFERDSRPAAGQQHPDAFHALQQRARRRHQQLRICPCSRSSASRRS